MKPEELNAIIEIYKLERPRWTNRYDAMDQALKAFNQIRKSAGEPELIFNK